MKVKSADQSAKNYISGAGTAGPRYTDAVKVADWQGPASSPEAQANYVAGVTDPANQARRQRKIAAVPNATWQTAAATLGGPIIGSRMTASAPKYQSGVSPYLSTLASMTLPPKTLDPATNVAQRVTPIAVALHAQKQAS